MTSVNMGDTKFLLQLLKQATADLESVRRQLAVVERQRTDLFTENVRLKQANKQVNKTLLEQAQEKQTGGADD